jgi:hypothetical protein
MRTRLLRAAIVALMALGSLAIWTVIPGAWLWVTRDLSGGARFIVCIAGSAITMLAAGALLYRLEGAHNRITGRPGREPAKPGWERSVAEQQRARRSLTLLDGLLVGSALVAAVALVVWWAFFADSPDPSGPLQPV